MARDWARLSYHDLKQIIRYQDEDAERLADGVTAALQERDNLREKLTARDAEIRVLQAKIELDRAIRENLAAQARELQADLDRVAAALIRKTQEADELAAKLDDLRHATAPGSVDNGDGTTTWQGLPVTIPSGFTPVAVRVPVTGERVLNSEAFRDIPCLDSEEWRQCVRVILGNPAPPPTWQAPAWLPDGEYLTCEYQGMSGIKQASGDWNARHYWPDMFRDLPLPTKPGRYRVVSGVGTRIGEA